MSATPPSHRCSLTQNARTSGCSRFARSSQPRLPAMRRRAPPCRTDVKPPGRILAVRNPTSAISLQISVWLSSMRSAPASACSPWRNGSRMVKTRPPTRSRASMTVTAAPFFVSSRAAVRPASPAPAMRTDVPRMHASTQSAKYKPTSERSLIGWPSYFHVFLYCIRATI